MLVVNADLRGTSRDTEKIVVYAHRFKRGRSIDSDGFEELTDKVYGENPITGDLGRLRIFSLTKMLSKPDAIKLIDALRHNTTYERIGFRILKREGYHIYAEGKRADLKLLPSQFTLGGDSSLSARGWIKRFLNLPFSTLQKVETPEQDKYYVSDKLTLNDFLRLRTLSWDTEFMHWWDSVKLEDLANDASELRTFLGMLEEHKDADLKSLGKPQLVELVEQHFNRRAKDASIGYHEQIMTSQMGELVDGRKVVHYFEHLSGRDAVLQRNLAIGDVTIYTHKDADAKSLARRVQGFFNEHPFLVMLSQNGMTYDLLNMQEYIDGEIQKDRKAGRKPELKPFTIYRQTPKIESSAAFYNKVVLPLFHIDFAAYSQYNLPFTVNNKFATVMSMILGRKIEKKESYEDLKRLTIEQIISQAVGSTAGERSAEALRTYGCEDAITLNDAANYAMTQVYFKSRLFKRNPEEICCTSKSMLALREYEFEHVIETLRPVRWNKDERIRYQNISASEEFLKLVKQETLQAVRKDTKTGIIDGSIYYIAPFIGIFGRMLKRNKVVQEIFEYIRGLGIPNEESSSQRTLARFDLLHAIEEGYLLPYIFEATLNEFSDVDPQKMVAQYTALAERFRPVNCSGNFYCFPRGNVKSMEFQEAMKGLGFLMAQGRLVSVEHGTFLLHDGTNIFKREFDARGNLGFKTLYQQEMIKDIIEIGFSDDPLRAIEYVKDFVSMLRQGRLERGKMIHFKKSVTRDYFNYSSYAQRQEMVRAYMQFGMKEGDEFAKVQLADGWKSVDQFRKMRDAEVFSDDNIEFLLDKYLGQRSRRGRNLGDGKIGKYLRPLVAGNEFDEDEIVSYIEGKTDMRSFGELLATKRTRAGRSVQLDFLSGLEL